MAIDPYLYPETDVLKNLPGIKDYARLQQFDALSTSHRISKLSLKPIPGLFDRVHLQRIHHYIFQDVYSWAGEFRTINIRKEGEFWFCRYEFIEQSLVRLFDGLKSENRLKNTSLQQFAGRAGFYLTELNAIHPFREGNGRAQREFIRELGLHAGLHVDWTLTTQNEIYTASLAGFHTGDSRSTEDLIARITSLRSK